MSLSLEVINNFSKKEFLYHELLIKNQNLIFNTDLNKLLDINNNNITINQTNNNNEYSFIKKQFANRFLAFVQTYQMENSEQDDSEYMTIYIKNLLNNSYFSKLLNDFANQNKLEVSLTNLIYKIE